MDKQKPLEDDPMKVTLNEEELFEAIEQYVRGSDAPIKPGSTFNIDMKAGRGENGFEATITINRAKLEPGVPVVSQPRPEPIVTRQISGSITAQAHNSVTGRRAELTSSPVVVEEERVSTEAPAVSRANPFGNIGRTPTPAQDDSVIEEIEDDATSAADSAAQSGEVGGEGDSEASDSGDSEEAAPVEEVSPPAKKSIFSFSKG